MSGGKSVLIFILVIGTALAASPKSFSIFNVVQFKNDPCVSSSTTMGSGNRNGTCYTTEECEEKNGKAEGNCASGFGVCCVFLEKECGATIDQNNTYIQNEDYPTAVTETGDCEYKVEKCDDAICTVRLDFEQFQIASWTLTADPLDSLAEDESKYVCEDSFEVTVSPATGLTIPSICGSNVGQHMYIELGTDSGATATLKFTFAATTASRNYEIKVSQFRCDSSYRPPEGCLQYHTGIDGRFTTFNWDGQNGHLQNQFYKICLRQEMGFCCTKYSICDDTAFEIDSQIAEDPAIAGSEDVAVTGTTCSMDYIIIESSSATGDITTPTTRYCGGVLSDFAGGAVNQAIIDCTPPFSVGVVTDAESDAALNEDGKGACFDYVQLPC